VSGGGVEQVRIDLERDPRVGVSELVRRTQDVAGSSSASSISPIKIRACCAAQ
jgi:hypothetical protein